MSYESDRISDIDDDLTALARSLGYSWPDEDVERWRTLKQMANTANRWRSECEQHHRERNEMWREFEQEKFIEHKNKRIQALTRKLRNVRRALRDYMAGQAAYIRELIAELNNSKGQ